jgi:hypothetical protein
MRARRGEFDVVVAQYHDQGLILMKYLGVDKGVNIIVGLPFVRTSVDRRTAFDIAGTGLADLTSLPRARPGLLAAGSPTSTPLTLSTYQAQNVVAVMFAPASGEPRLDQETSELFSSPLSHPFSR